MKKSLSKVLLSSLGAGVVTLCMAVSSWSMPAGGTGHPDPARMLSHMSTALDLTAEQQDAVETLLTSSAEEAAPDRERMRTLRKELKAQSKSFNPDNARRITDEIGKITGRLAYRKAHTHSEIYQLLDTEQQVKMDELMQQRDGHRQQWRKGRHGATNEE